MRDRLDVRSHTRHVIAGRTFRTSKRMKNIFLLIAGNAQQRSVLWVPKVLLLSRLHSQTDSSGKVCLSTVNGVDTGTE